MKQRNMRLLYGAVFLALLAAELCIALFVRDRFVRPYVGDMLVTVLLCCLGRVVFPDRIRLLPVYVFALAALVEVGQFFDFVKLLGLEGNRFLSVLLGRTFSWWDLVCYAAGCIVFRGVELAVKALLERKRGQEI